MVFRNREFLSHSRIFHSNGDVNIAGEGLQILTYARHSWPLSSEGSLTCHTYCDTGLPLIMVISEDPLHSHLLPSVWQWSCHYLLLRLRSVATADRNTISRMRGERSTSTLRFIQMDRVWCHKDLQKVVITITCTCIFQVFLMSFLWKQILRVWCFTWYCSQAFRFALNIVLNFLTSGIIVHLCLLHQK